MQNRAPPAPSNHNFSTTEHLHHNTLCTRTPEPTPFLHTKPWHVAPPLTLTSQYTYVDDDSNRLLTVDFGKGTDEEGFWTKGNFEERYPGVENPWKGADASAPYDQKFYVVMNVAVGGVSGFFPDGMVGSGGEGRG